MSFSAPADLSAEKQLARAVPPERFDAAWAAYQAARVAGLCHEGAWEAALGAAAPEPRNRPLSPHP